MEAVELHLHTCFSFLEGASLPEEHAARAADLGYRALAITDHDGLYGAMEFAQACATAGVQPIIGVELTLPSGHLTVLAETERGYANLCRLITLAHRNTRAWEPGATHRLSDDPQKPLLEFDVLAQHREGLIVLSGCRQGELARLVDRERIDEAVRAAERLKDVFGAENAFIGMQHKLVEGHT